MKKILAILLALAMVLSFAACGEKKEDENKENKKDKDSEAVEELALVEFDPIVVADNDECSITVTGYEIDDIWGNAVNLTLENKSADKTYSFNVASASVNGVGCSALLFLDVEPGETEETSVTIMDETLEMLGIKEYTDIELAFDVRESSVWDAPLVVDEVVNVYPYGEDNAYTFVREEKPDTDIVIMDNEYVKATIIGAEKTDLVEWYSVYIYIENKSDKHLCLSLDGATVNGKDTTPFFFPDVEVGKVTVGMCTLMELEELGIEEVEELEFDLILSDYDNWVGDDLAKEHIIYNP